MSKMKSKYEHHSMGFEPVYDEKSRIMVLGSFPSVKSRDEGFYYGNVQNRFWRVIATVTGRPIPKTIAQKKELLLSQGIAIWDVIESCDIIGSADSTIKNVIPADIAGILKTAKIEKIFVNGQTAGRLYDRFLLPITKIEANVLPSTSPANARMNIDDLVDAWSCIKE